MRLKFIHRFSSVFDLLSIEHALICSNIYLVFHIVLFHTFVIDWIKMINELLKMLSKFFDWTFKVDELP